ncbi:MAG: hypothetical protein KGQ28_11310, partial [Hyphomicrobiales bacterium]|nr:hypothetical protein [Hyphomicrobiales bacterium]
MSRFARPARALALAALFAAAPALAQQSTPPSAEQLAAAKALLLDSGVGISVHYLIPRMMDSLATGVLRTRPELKDKLKATLTRLEPEFMKEEPSLF